MRKAALIAALRTQRGATIHRLAALDEAAWGCPTPLAPGPDGSPPTVAAVAAHLVLADEVALGPRPVLARLLGRDDHRWDAASIARLAALTPGELLAALARRGETLARLANATAGAAGRVPVRGSLGRQPLLLWWYRRILHEWLHEHDIAVATGGATSTPTPDVAEVLAAAVLHALPAAALPHVPVTTGTVRLLVDVAPVQPPDDAELPPPAAGRRTWGFDFARKQYGPRVVGLPDASVWLHASGLALVAGHRTSWRDLPPAQLRIVGQHDLAAELLDTVENAGAAIPELAPASSGMPGRPQAPGAPLAY